MTSPLASLPELLGRPLEGVARVTFTEERHRKFRWLFVLELALFGLGCLIILPCLALAMLGGGDLGQLDLPSFKGRSYTYWKEIAVRFLGPRGEVLAEARGRPSSASEAHGALVTLLGAARRHGLVVTHFLQPLTGTPELAAVYFGARPLLASPELRSAQSAASVLTACGATAERANDSVTLRAELERTPAWMAWLMLLLLALPLSPILALTRSGRRLIADLYSDATGGPARVRALSARADLLTTQMTKGDEVREQSTIDAGELVAIVHGPWLAQDRDVTRRPPELRLLTKSGAVTLPGMVPGPPGAGSDPGAALRDLLIASILELRAARPDLGLMDGPRPIRCPFCAGTYELKIGAVCPHCGAPATAVV